MGGERCPEGPCNEADCTEGRNEVKEPGTGLQTAGTGLEETDDRTRCCGGSTVDKSSPPVTDPQYCAVVELHVRFALHPGRSSRLGRF